MNQISRRTDPTFAAECLFGSARWVCMTLGVSYETFRKGRRLELEAQGLPVPDPILNLWNKADVIAWVENRRRLRNLPLSGASAGSERVKRNAL